MWRLGVGCRIKGFGWFGGRRFGGVGGLGILVGCSFGWTWWLVMVVRIECLFLCKLLYFWEFGFRRVFGIFYPF